MIPNPPARRPLKLFILGPERSGTSITYMAARQVFKLPGRGESHVFPIYQRVQKLYEQYAATFRDRPGNLAKDLDPAVFKRAVLAQLRDFYRAAYGGESFVDKTPGAEAVAGVGLILEAFPEARIIVTMRTGIEVVRSYMVKFSAGFEGACNAWTSCMQAVAKVRDSSPNLIAIDQFDMTNAAEDLAVRVCRHVQRQGRITDLTRHFIEQRHGTSSTHDWRRRQTLADTGWTDAEKAIFRRICGPTMEEFGYPI
jgi:hypothetical protein